MCSAGSGTQLRAGSTSPAELGVTRGVCVRVCVCVCVCVHAASSDNSTMYTMAGVMTVALVSNALIRPVDPKYHLENMQREDQATPTQDKSH